MTNIYDSLGINGGLNISANSTTDAIYISQLGTGNAVLIEDSANPDATPFIINSGGSVNIGRIEYLKTSGGTEAKLQVNNSTSQIPSSGLPFTTNFIVQGFNNNNVGFFTTDINTSQLYFGTPSSVYGAKLSWRYTGGTFDLSTQTTGGTITFGTDQGLERMRIQSDGNVGIGTTAATSTLTVNGSLSATTLYGDGSNLTGISGGGSFTGGTVTGDTTFTNTVSANTISATTLYVSGNSISRPYKVYTALLTQTGTTAPVAIVLENTLGVEPTYMYNDVGEYNVNTVISFDFNKIAFMFGNNSFQVTLDIASYEGGNEMFFFTPNNNMLYNYPIEIRVYN